MRILLVTAGVLGLFSSAAAEPVFEVTGLAAPESFVVDPATGNYFISNINGASAEKDHNGFITKLDPDGKAIALKWVESSKEEPLDAPKGLAVTGKTVYVTDIDHVRGYDTESGKRVADIDFTPLAAKFLNDLAADAAGNLYATDMFANVVYKVEPAAGNKITAIAKGEGLAKPNGVTIDPKTGAVVVVTWETGKVLEVAADGTLKPLADAGAKNLDGVVYDGEGNLYVSSYTGGKVFKIAPDGKATTILEGQTTPADIGIDLKKGLLLVPAMKANKAWAQKLTS